MAAARTFKLASTTARRRPCHARERERGEATDAWSRCQSRVVRISRVQSAFSCQGSAQRVISFRFSRRVVRSYINKVAGASRRVLSVWSVAEIPSIAVQTCVLSVNNPDARFGAVTSWCGANIHAARYETLNCAEGNRRTPWSRGIANRPDLSQFRRRWVKPSISFRFAARNPQRMLTRLLLQAASFSPSSFFFLSRDRNDDFDWD